MPAQAAMTKYGTLGDLFTTNIYFSQFWSRKTQDQGTGTCDVY